MPHLQDLLVGLGGVAEGDDDDGHDREDDDAEVLFSTIQKSNCFKWNSLVQPSVRAELLAWRQPRRA